MATQHEIIGEEWAARAGELADWAMERLVNRKDVWGQYTVLTPAERQRTGKDYKALTLPARDQRGGDRVTLDKLTRHFASRHHRKPQIIGLHAKSEDDTSRWFALDIDLHDETETNAEDHARRNLNGALGWCRKFQADGYDPMLFSSNGYGGYHIWVLLAEPAPTRDVHAYVKAVAESWEEAGLDEEPEIFPKALRRDSIGAWFRLPGLHHSREWYSALYSWDEWLEDPWLKGHAAIDAMLDNIPGPPPPAARAKGGSRRTVRSTKPAGAFVRTGRARVCVDLDGVLAQRAGGPMTEIGPPMDGALEFMRALHEFADITILTSRMAAPGEAQRRERVEAIRRWLDTHGFPDATVHEGIGKPVAHAYIDDRAVACRPVDDGPGAFDEALMRTRVVAGEPVVGEE